MTAHQASTVMRLIDHTNLKPYSSEADIRRTVDEAIAFGVYAVCVQPVFARLAREHAKSRGSELRVSVVLDFPHGASISETRTELALKYAALADEVDAVCPIALVKSARWEEVERDVRSLTRACHSLGTKVKLITEDAYTTPEEKVKLYTIVARSGADFIKTSTGFEEKEYSLALGNATGAQPANVRLMKKVSEEAGSRIGIKVSGGIRTVSQIHELLEQSGRPATPENFRVGTSRTSEIYEELRRNPPP
jgi:deoxyribose-phosphate aldolase